MSALAGLLLAHREELLTRWRERVAGAPELGEHAAPLLDALLEALRPEPASSTPTPPFRPEPAGPRPGVDLERVLAEYAALHALVLELPAPGPLAVEDARRVAAFFHQAAARAALEAVRGSPREEARHRSEGELGLLLDSIPVLVSFVTADERYGRVNRAYLSWFGLTEAQLHGRKVREVIGEEAYAVLGPHVRRGLAGESFSFEQHGVPYRLGGTRDVKVSFMPHRAANGRVEGYVAMLQDITETRRLAREREEALASTREAQALAEAERVQLEVLAEEMRHGEARLALALEASGMGFWEMDLGTGRYTADARFRELFGLDHDAPVTRETGLSLVHAEDRERVGRSVTDALAGRNGGAYAVEYRTVRQADGGYRWLSVRGQAYFNPDGEGVRFAGTGLDVTERKNAELAQTRLLRSIADQDVFGVAVLAGPELRFTLANAGYRAFVGGRDVVGRAFLEAIPEARDQGVAESLLSVLRTKKALTLAETRLRVDARGQGVVEPRDYTFTWQPIFEADGSVRSVLILGVDVTEGVRARERAEALAQLEHQRAEFAQQLIGIVSHDLRNPLGAIRLGAATLQLRDVLDSRASRTVARIQSATDRAERMVRDLLDFTQVRLAGGLQLERQPTDLHVLTHGVVQEVEEAQPGVLIRHEARGDGRGTWDADRLQQVVQNLVTNALKYGRPGEAVSVLTEGHEGTVTLSVHNLGEPIPTERQASLFQPMQRGVEGVDRQGRSVGLGLFIVRAIAEAHGGTVELTSRAGEGTTFRIVLPRV